MVFPLHTLILAEEDAQKQAELASAVPIAERYSDHNFLWRFFREEAVHIKRSTFVVGEWINEKMLASHFRRIAAVTVFLLLVAGILACELPGLGGGTKPTVLILSPASGVQVKAGETVAIQSSATDARGVTRVELWVDGSLARSDVSPQQPVFSITQEWTAAVLGSHSVTVKAYNAAGRVSDPATVTVNVVEEVTAAPTTLSRATLPPGVPWATITEVLNVRRGPGTHYPVMGQLQQNDVVEIVGRNADSSWLQIVYPTGTIGWGWISVSYAQVSGSLASIPVVEAPPPPTPTPASSL